MAELEVVGPIDLPHPAAADEADDAESLREDGARREGTGHGRVRREAPDRRRRRLAAPGDQERQGGTQGEKRGKEVERHPELAQELAAKPA